MGKGVCRGPYRRYDHRLKVLIARNGSAALAADLGVPASTARTWIRERPVAVVGHEVLDPDRAALEARILELEKKCSLLEAKLALVASLREIMGWQLDFRRFPGAETKERLLKIIEAARESLTLQECLGVIGLTLSRYKNWLARRHKCELEDHSSCPRVSPARLTAKEALAMAEMTRDPRYAHFPARALAYHAARTGAVVVSPTTWMRRIREHGWKRPRRRLYPARPRIGLRAPRPNEYWHIDTTIFRLLDGTRAALHVCLDNFSRYVLAWRVARTPTALGCRELLADALKASAALNPPAGIPRVLCDSGSENVNGLIDRMIREGRIIREIAQVEVDYSNSLVEAFFKSAKHNFLFNVPLPSVEALEERAAFYIREHNEVMPHAAFRGATPEEIYTGGWAGLVEDSLGMELRWARRERIAYHRGLAACVACGGG